MREQKGPRRPTPQLAMLLPITGGVKAEVVQAVPNDEEALRELLLAQLAKAGLRASKQASVESE